MATPLFLKRTLLAVFLLVPIVNFGVFLLPGGDRQFANMVSTRVDAAGYAFSIWGIIFAMMIAFSILVQRLTESSKSLTAATAALIIAGIASIFFVPISLYASQTIGWLDIVLHLVALIAALVFLRRHCHAVSVVNGRWSFVGPSMYCGWISAATLISTALMLQENGVDVSDQIATGIAIGALALITTIASLMTWSRDPVYGGTIAWALIAIGVQQSAFPLIRWTAWLGAAALTVFIITFMILNRSFYAAADALRLPKK
ncbi:hypothetical protein [Planctomycetes bacterium K23_9]|uniref:Uncharacterized protein n=1 Tax=Stieleria marina TaxID=1930275 RepID=A0A517NQ70_9BACT|nr:hypothetical protein K239x_12130 [Planctomycetes bacterium K23_9]